MTPPSDAAATVLPLATPAPVPTASLGPHWWVILGVSVAHLINDVMQSLLSALYPVLQAEFDLSFTQIGLMSLAFMGTASVLQPLIGLATDRHPMPQALALGMAATLLGLIALAVGPSYAWLVLGAGLIGLGSAVFHPEASRVARAAAGGRFGTAQSFFQVGGNAGHAVGPLLAAFVVVPLGRLAVGAFAALALAGMALLAMIGRWHEAHRRAAAARPAPRAQTAALPRSTVILSLAVLALLVLSKNAYTAAMGSYYTFFTMARFDLGPQGAQLMLFVYLAASAAGVLAGGLVGDRVGPLRVIWVSILGVLPLTLLLPFAGFGLTVVLSIAIGFVMASAFPAIVVFAQELVPGRVGLVAGIFFGLAFGVGGIAAAALGPVADARGIEFVFALCAWLPAMGLLTVFLPQRSV
jgi:MFS transporter, FSR family, fosmidomycin resistance protein